MFPSGGLRALRKPLVLAAILVIAAASAATVRATVPPVAQAATATAPSPEVVAWRHRVAYARYRALIHAHMVGANPVWVRWELRSTSPGYLRYLVGVWNARSRVWYLYWRANYPKLMCIHSREGAWNAYSPAGYYGGLQMDWSFMRAYGADKLRKYGWHDARYWTAGDQMAVGMRAVRVRGYWPWSTSASACGAL